MTAHTPESRTRKIHPGSGRRTAPLFPKGRLLDTDALKTVQSILAARPRQRDMLIEFLHLIQDDQGHLSAAMLQALAEEMRLSMAEVYEVASFYAHFDIVLDGEDAPPEITVRVCDSLTCEMNGAKKLLTEMTTLYGKSVRVIPAPCMGRCATAPVCEVGHRHVDKASVKSVQEIIDAKDFAAIVPEYQDLSAYQKQGGYDVLKECLTGKRSIDDVITTMSDAGLRGLGGAGFPTGRKWTFVRAEAGPRLMAVNADEGEPGTFKDRHYLESEPHRFLEGMLIAAWVVEAETVYIYLRDEYPAARKILQAEIARIEAAGLSDHVKIDLRRGAGAYICGEESAMIESIEGKRGLPRNRPPYVAQVGIFNRPTLVNNVETLFWVPDILKKGADWFSGQGTNGGVGFRSYSVSGRVNKPGVKLAPAGVTIQDLIDDYCDGMADGHTFKAYLPGGASGGILPASMNDLPLDFGQLEKYGSFVGSHAVVVLSDKDNMKDVALNLMRFFEDESCGQCTPCRNGTEKAVKMMARDEWDEQALADLAQVMLDASICGLGQAAPNPLNSVLKYFAEDL